MVESANFTDALDRDFLRRVKVIGAFAHHPKLAAAGGVAHKTNVGKLAIQEAMMLNGTALLLWSQSEPSRWIFHPE